MSSRLRTVTIAVVFGLAATLAAAFYLNSVKAGIVDSGAKQGVFVAAANIPAGTPISAVLDRNMAVKKEIPKQYIADDALPALNDFREQITVASVSRGEQMTLSKLRPADRSEVVYKLPEGKIALAIPVDEVTGVGGRISGGDRVVLVAAFSPGPGGADISRVLFTDIEVLVADGQGAKPGVGAAGVKRTIILAVTPGQAEKLVFAEEKGQVWVGLSRPHANDLPATAGSTMESVFN